MILGIDIDGTLTNHIDFILERGAEFFGKPPGMISYYMSEVFGVTEEQDWAFWHEVIWDYAKIPPREDAVRVMQQLKSDGHALIINTKRWCPDESMKHIVHNWFVQHNIPFDVIEFAPEDGGKLAVVQKHGIQIMVDDSPDELELLSPHIPVICFDNLYNKHIDAPRASNWDDVYEHIKIAMSMRHTQLS